MTISKPEDRIYVRFHSEEFEKAKLDEIKAYDKSKSNLFGGEREKVWQEANEIILKEVTRSEEPPMQVQVSPVISDTSLWVEKYRPKKYYDLLSDESTNRSLLQWLKLWDKIVFKREVTKNKVAKPGELSNFNKRTGRFEQNGGWKRKQRGSLNTELDANNVPIQKVSWRP